MTDWHPTALAKLRTDGIYVTPNAVDAPALIAHLHEHPVINAHVWAKGADVPRSLEFALANKPWPMFCHTMEAIVTAPGVLEAALNLHALATEYFGEDTLIYSMNAFWTQPSAGPQYADTHQWHCDGDDRKQMVMFIAGTDVEIPEDGAHLYQKGSHNVRLTGEEEQAGKRGYDLYHPPEAIVETVIAKAGTIFLTDPWGMHMAGRPQRKARLLCWARFGVSDPPASYGWDKLSPVPRAAIGARYPTDPKLRQAIRLVVA